MLVVDSKLVAAFVRAAVVLSLLAGTAAGAQAPPPPLAPLALEGDAERGQRLAFTCSGCHGIPGYRNVYPSYLVPKLGGQPADYLEVALQGYRRATRPHQTMQAQTNELSDQDIADLAAYFASRVAAPTTGTYAASAARIQAGRSKVTNCIPCHGDQGVAPAPQWPNLAGQHASYLAYALTQYKTGARRDPIMEPMMSELDAEAIAEIAAFYASQPHLFTVEPD
jgi:cytochrome c553